MKLPLSTEQIVIGVLFVAAVYMILNRSETFENENEVTESVAPSDKPTPEPAKDQGPEPAKDQGPVPAKDQGPEPAKDQGPVAYMGDSTSLELQNAKDAHIDLKTCNGSTQFMSSNLLPKDDPQMQDFAEFAPTLDGKNFVDAYKYVFGSESQSLRNANRQLRSDPPNPQDTVCPWMQSTITPENRRPLEIGTGQ